MSTTEIRKDLHHYIDIIDERLLSALHAMMQEYVSDSKRIVAYKTDGTPLNQEDFISEVQEAHNNYKNGKTKTNEEVLEAIKLWK